MGGFRFGQRVFAILLRFSKKWHELNLLEAILDPVEALRGENQGGAPPVHGGFFTIPTLGDAHDSDWDSAGVR